MQAKRLIISIVLGIIASGLVYGLLTILKTEKEKSRI